MPKNITITVNNDSFAYDPNRNVNRSSTVTFQLGAQRVSAVVTLDPDCFTKPSITLSQPGNPSEGVGIQSGVPNGCYGFSTPKVTILEASQSKSKGKGEEGGPLVGDVEVVTDPVEDKDQRKKGAKATARRPCLSAG